MYIKRSRKVVKSWTMKYPELRTPTQLLIQGQWWSHRSIQRSSMLQWWERGVVRTSHRAQISSEWKFYSKCINSNSCLRYPGSI